MTAVATMTSLSSVSVSAEADTDTAVSKTAVVASDDVGAVCELLWRDATAGSGCGVRWGRVKAGKGRRGQAGESKQSKLVFDRAGRAGDVSVAIPRDRHVAVEVYNAQGRTRMLPVDLDTKHAGDNAAELVVRAAFEVTALVETVGGASVWDISDTSEGIHVLILLPEAAERDEIAPVARGLKQWVKAKVGADMMDTRPALGPGGSCITMPGTLDKGGLARQLMTPPRQAAAAVSQRGRPGVLARLHQALADHIPAESSCDSSSGVSPVSSPARQLVPRPRRGSETLVMAWARGRVGVPAQYVSSSEARLAALKSLAGAGRDAESVWDEVCGGDLPGVAESFEHNRSLDTARGQFDHEWALAVRGLGPGAIAGPPSTRLQLRMISRALDMEAAQASTRGQRQRIRVMRGVVYAAAVAGTLTVNHGCRSYTFAAGLPSHGAVAQVMNAEDAAGADGFVTAVNRTISPTSGIRWRLQLPQRYAHLADPQHRDEVHATSIEPVHAAYSALGMAAMWLLDALETSEIATVAELAQAAGVSATRTASILAKLAELGLAARSRHGRWCRTTASLDDAATALGVPEAIEARRQQYTDQRACWRAFWEQVTTKATTTEPADEMPPFDAWFAPVWTGSPPAGADPPA